MDRQSPSSEQSEIILTAIGDADKALTEMIRSLKAARDVIETEDYSGNLQAINDLINSLTYPKYHLLLEYSRWTDFHHHRLRNE